MGYYDGRVEMDNNGKENYCKHNLASQTPSLESMPSTLLPFGHEHLAQLAQPLRVLLGTNETNEA